MKRLANQAIVIAGGLALALLFNQCGGGSTESSKSQVNPSTSLTAPACSGDLKTVFERTYYPFVTANCAGCHADAAGRGFANADLSIAFDQFKQVGYARISANAVNDSHNPPWTGAKHTETINTIQGNWEKALDEFTRCTSQDFGGGSVSYDVAVETNELAIPDGVDVNKNKAIIWNLKKADLIGNTARIPDNFAATLKAEIGVHKDTAGNRTYFITGLKIYQSNSDLIVKTVGVKYNAALITWETTFMFANALIYKNQAEGINGLLSGGAMILPTTAQAGDKIALTFGTLEATSLPAPQGLPQISFDMADVTLVKTPNDGLATEVEMSFSLSFGVETVVSVSLDQEPFNEGVVVPTPVKDFQCNRGKCTGEDIKAKNSRNRSNYAKTGYVWDYELPDGKTFSFRPLEKSAKLRIRFSGDIRKEANQLLALKLANPVQATLGSKSKIYFLTEKLYNPEPTPGIITYRALLASTGLMGTYCVKCHNSVTKNGGYDITDYDLMVSRGVLVPGSVSSKMFRRMNDDPEFKNLSKMPLDGYRPPEEREVVANWILNGAKND